jgi:uncharacterized protein (TIGR02001 family)
MRKILLAAGALLLALSLHAEDSKSSYSITTDFTYVSEYIFRGIEQQDQAFQPSVTFIQDTLTLGVWTSQGINNQNLVWAQGSEIDLTGSYGIPFGEKYTFLVGGTYYWYPSARDSLGEPGYTWELSGGVAGPVGPLTGSATYFHDFKLKANTFEFTLAYSVPLSNQNSTLDVSAGYGFNDIGDGNGGLPGESGYDYRYYHAHATYGYKLTPATTLKIGLHFVDVSKLAGAPGANLWFSVGLTAGL